MFLPHIDTMYFTASPKDVSVFSAMLEGLLQAKEQGNKRYNGFELLPRFKNYCIGFINTCGVKVFLGLENEIGDALPIFVQVPANVMLQYWTCLDKLLIRCAVEFGGFITTKINRFDITVDTDECEVSPSWIKKLKTRSKSGTWVVMGSEKDDEKFTSYIQTKGFTGITRGSGDASTVYFRLYDKLEELKRKRKLSDEYLSILLQNGWNGLYSDRKTKKVFGTIWRFEWEFKRDRLREMGIETCEQAFSRVNEIFFWLISEWVYPSDNSGLKKFWFDLSLVKFNLLEGKPLNRIPSVNITMLEKQMVGVLRRISQERNYSPSDVLEYICGVLERYESEFIDIKKEDQKVPKCLKL